MATKTKTVTVNQLHRMLGKLIERGCGRLPACINKRTFQHPLEGDGCVILPVGGVDVELITEIDGDGFTKTTKAGLEVSHRTAVLFGESGHPFLEVLSEQVTDGFIESLEWGGGATEKEKQMVANSIHHFARYLRAMTQ